MHREEIIFWEFLSLTDRPCLCKQARHHGLEIRGSSDLILSVRSERLSAWKAAEAATTNAENFCTRVTTLQRRCHERGAPLAAWK